MPRAKLALDRDLLERLDAPVDAAGFPSRSQAVESAIAEKRERLDRTRLARGCARLDPAVEQAMADGGLGLDGRNGPPPCAHPFAGLY